VPSQSHESLAAQNICYDGTPAKLTRVVNSWTVKSPYEQVLWSPAILDAAW
jgi:hypothetical protein